MMEVKVLFKRQNNYFKVIQAFQWLELRSQLRSLILNFQPQEINNLLKSFSAMYFKGNPKLKKRKSLRK